MSMVTRCPACGTGFRVSAEQLKAQRGTVRCGRCSTVFNAFDTLATLADAPTPAGTEAAAIEVASAVSSEAQAPVVDVRERHRGAEAEQTESAAPEPPPEDTAAAQTPVHAAASGSPGRIRRRGRPGPWAAGSFVLLLAFAAQLSYVFRIEIANAQPRARPWLEQACAHLGCTVPYPRNIQQWSIEFSDLQSDPDDPARMTLTAVLRNRASFIQGYPALELTLTDTQDRAVARRVLGAADYLPPEAKAAPGLGPNSEVTLRLAMDTGELNAAGYRLYLFYP
jgi:predicted Zn finger-like uncharacterized protein